VKKAEMLKGIYLVTDKVILPAGSSKDFKTLPGGHVFFPSSASVASLNNKGIKPPI
jgi:hypothetical protein